MNVSIVLNEAQTYLKDCQYSRQVRGVGSRKQEGNEGGSSWKRKNTRKRYVSLYFLVQV